MVSQNLEFNVVNKILPIAYPIRMDSDIIYNSNYHCKGINRKGEQQYLFLYTFEGYGIFKHKDTEYIISPGKAFYCKVSDIDVKYYYPKNGKEPWRFIWITFIGMDSENLMKEIINLYGHVYTINKNSEIISRLQYILETNKYVCEISASYAGKLINDILMKLILTQSVNLHTQNQSRLVTKSIEYILSNIEKGIRVASIATELNVSREHFSRIFKDNMGITPLEYIINKKVSHACRLLKETTLSCKEISNSLGYENTTNFIRMFKKLTKMSPKVFRKDGVLSIDN